MKTIAQRKLTDEVLRESSKHLHYEYWMLVSIANALASVLAEKGWLQNALIESFVIHYRVLFDFFYVEPRGDDSSAGHYFDSAEDWARLRPPKTELLRKSRKRTGKEIVHLTYARLDVSPETKGWQFQRIAEDINRVVQMFLQNVPTNRLGNNWNQTVPEPVPLLCVALPLG